MWTKPQGKSVLINLIIKMIKELENYKGGIKEKLQEMKNHFNKEI